MTTQSIVCQRCGTIDDYHVEKKGPHDTAICNGCGKYIKHLPKPGSEPTFYFGQYKGKKVSEIMDADYLQYCWDKMKLSTSMMEAIDKQLQHIHSLS